MTPHLDHYGLYAFEPEDEALLGYNDVGSSREACADLLQGPLETGEVKVVDTALSPHGYPRPRTSESRDLTAEIHNLSSELGADEDELCRDEPPQVPVVKIIQNRESNKLKPPLSAARALLLKRGANSRERSRHSKSKNFARLPCCSEMEQVQRELQDVREQFTRSMFELSNAKRALVEEVQQLECEKDYLVQEVAPDCNDDGETIEAICAKRDMLRWHLDTEEEDRQAKLKAASSEIKSLKQQTQQLRTEISEGKAALEVGKDAHRRTMKDMMQKDGVDVVMRIYQEELEKEREKGYELQKNLEAAEEQRIVVNTAADVEVHSREQEIERLLAEKIAVENGNDSNERGASETPQQSLRRRKEVAFQLEIEIAVLKEPALKLLQLFGEDLQLPAEAGSEVWITKFASALDRIKAALQSRVDS